MRDTADYERSEAIAVRSGKKVLSEAPWLFNRSYNKKGFFAELSENDFIHPNHYAVHCVDGVGTKLFLAPLSGDYSSQMIDGIEMNANDFATMIHAYPDNVNLYLAMQTEVEEMHMGEIMTGIRNGLERIRIPNAPYDLNIGKLETASLDEMISLGVKNKGFDVGIVMTGYIDKTKVPNLNPQPGNIIIGNLSTGLHSNGYTGARHALFFPDVEYRKEWKSQYKGRHKLDDKPGILEGKTVLESLIVPTADYLVEAALIGQQFDNRDIYGINITGNGLHNFNRAGEGVSFEITDPFEPLPIHKLLVQESGWNLGTAYKKQNMGMGFAYIVPSLEIAEEIVKLINNRGQNTAKIIGEVRESKEKDLKTILHTPYEANPIDFVGYFN